MAKVVRLFNDKEKSQQGLISHIEKLLDMAKRGEIKNILVSAETTEEKEVLTGYYNLDVGERQYLIGHLQADITMAVVEANVDKLIERI